MSVKNGIRNSILKILKKHPQGLTILEISELIDKNRVTVAKYVYGLTIEGLIRQRRVGPAKLCYLRCKRGKK